MILHPDTLAAFREHVLAEYPKEACGFVVDGKFVPVENVAEDPYSTFRVATVERMRVSGLGEVQAFLHSHPYSLAKPLKYPAEWPSTPDMTSWMADNIPWGICATEGEGITQLVWLDENNPEPLIGREFIHGINDCYSVIRDWFKLEQGIVIPNFARGMEWWFDGRNLYDDNFERAGFITIPFDDLRVGDCVLFKVRSPVTNHAAVVTGPNEIVHHMWNRQSGHDTLAKWNRVINRAVRYVGAGQ